MPPSLHRPDPTRSITATAGWSRRRFIQNAGLAASLAFTPAAIKAQPSARGTRPETGREDRADVLIVGGSFGGVAASLAAARRGCSVILTEETDWIGGQATGQGVPLDEHPWIEQYGRTRSYAEFRTRVREYYRRDYPLSAAARSDPHLNPGAGWVSALCFEPRVGLAVLYEMLAPHLASGRIRILLRQRPVTVHMDGDQARAVTVADESTGVRRTIAASYIIDGTELGDVLELGGIESVTGAESRAETGEPLAREGPPRPLDQMVFTHVFALDHRPGEEHVIDRPREYDIWRNSPGGRARFVVPDLFGLRQDYFGRPIKPGGYAGSTWSFRRLLCRTNLMPGAVPSDVTVAIWPGNEYRQGVLCGVPPAERQKHLDAARQLSLSFIYWLQTEAPNLETGGHGFPGLSPRGDVFGTDDGLAPFPYTRESRRLRAEFTVLEQHFRTDTPGNRNGPVKYRDSVGLSGYRIDIHKPARGGSGSVTEAAHGKHWVQQIPLGALIPVRVENVLPAAKNLGVTAVTNGAFRVHPTEWNIGEAAGALAAFCRQRRCQPRQVRNTSTLLADFQQELVRDGVELDWPRLDTARSYYSHHNLELKDADTFYFGEAARLPPAR